MRAYRLQDAGLDTRDANTMLGFEDDERDYAAAALMLRILNCTRIVLLTNNPAKLDGLTKAGIEITARVPDDKSSTLRAQIWYSESVGRRKVLNCNVSPFALSCIAPCADSR